MRESNVLFFSDAMGCEEDLIDECIADPVDDLLFIG